MSPRFVTGSLINESMHAGTLIIINVATQILVPIPVPYSYFFIGFIKRGIPPPSTARIKQNGIKKIAISFLPNAAKIPPDKKPINPIIPITFHTIFLPANA